MKRCKLCNKILIKINGGKNWERKIYCNKKCKCLAHGRRYTQNNKKKISEYQKNWYLKNRLKVLAKQKIYQKENWDKIKVKLKLFMRKYRKDEEFRRKDNIRRLTNYKFKKEDKCKFCSSTKKLEFHHKIYRLPLNKKDTITICKKCHGGINNGSHKP